MVNWYGVYPMQMSRMISEDAGVPELLNPRASAMRDTRGWFRRLFGLK